MEASVSTDKLMVVKKIIDDIQDPHRLKSITVSWKVLDSEELGDSMWVPTLHIEYYEGTRPRGIDIEISDGKVDDVSEVNETP